MKKFDVLEIKWYLIVRKKDKKCIFFYKGKLLS